MSYRPTYISLTFIILEWTLSRNVLIFFITLSVCICIWIEIEWSCFIVCSSKSKEGFIQVIKLHTCWYQIRRSNRTTCTDLVLLNILWARLMFVLLKVTCSFGFRAFFYHRVFWNPNLLRGHPCLKLICPPLISFTV